jgi:Peptidase A4 family
VGLGGFSLNSKALEQVGTEVDCNALGRVVSSAWDELVPAPSRNIRMRVDPGDVMNGSVIAAGQRVTLTLNDLTRGTTYTRRVHASPIDITSADWIVEAPSECAGTSFCQPLALADFGTASFTRGRAVTVGGHAGSISDRRWVTTKISLATQGQHFINGTYGASGAQALPSALTAGGSAFSVVYHGPTTTITSPTTTTTSATRSSTARAAARGR